MKLPISVFIITKNEADRVAATIKSVRSWVDEVIVVDSGSDDGTIEVAKAAGADKVMFNEWHGYGQQKIFCETQCQNDWLLNLDADEEISPALRDEIMTQFADVMPEANNAFKLRCVNMFAHQAKPSRFAFVNDPIRLYNKNSAGFRDALVHDAVVPQAGVEVHKFKGAVFHRSFRSMEHMVRKLNDYSTMQAAELFARGKNFSVARGVIEPHLMFWKFYILRRHFVYGFFGLTASRNYAHYRFLRLAKLRELYALEKLKKIDSNNKSN
jgi:glycosyltransferase involved in cell wall biosynthesis